MSFALTHFAEKIIINKDFADLLATELKSNNLVAGTILLAADEILLKADEIGARFPGRYDIVLVADRFESSGGKINLSGSNGAALGPDKSPAGIGDKGEDAGSEPGAHGGLGGAGKHGHEGKDGEDGKNIKVFCSELKLEGKDIISNGGNGGIGGKGGRGGPGGKGGPGGPPGKGGQGGIGGKGGKGGNGGKIELLFCSAPNGFVVSDHLMSSGGNRGTGGEGGEGGFSAVGTLGKGSMGEIGVPGVNSIPNVRQVQFSELWEKVSVEFKTIPA